MNSTFMPRLLVSKKGNEARSGYQIGLQCSLSHIASVLEFFWGPRSFQTVRAQDRSCHLEVAIFTEAATNNTGLHGPEP